MDKKEAQFILSAYRPSGRDASDSRIAEALKLTETDPALKKWFESEIRQDSAIADKLQTIRPPEGLREEILAGMKMVETSPRWWRQAPFLAIAATIIVVFGLLFSWQRPTYESEFEELRANAVSYAAGFISLDFFSDQLPDLVTWLSERGAPASDHLVASLDSMSGIGCRTLNWSGTTVSLICLRSDNVYHVFMVEKDKMAAPFESAEPQIWEMKQRTVASWCDATRIYIMVTKASPDEVRLML